jgi:hypothetical protein
MNTENYNSELATSMPQMAQPKLYVVDFNKIDTLDKLKAIIVAIGFAFDSQHPFFNQLESLLMEVDPDNKEQQLNELQEQLEALGLEKVEEGKIIQF